MEARSPEQLRSERLARLRFWLADHAAGIGFVLALLLLLGLGAGMVRMFNPFQRGEPIAGVVRSIAWTDFKSEHALLARVDYDGGTAFVRLHWPTYCVVGGPIQLVKRKASWGAQVSASYLPCAPQQGAEERLAPGAAR